MLRSQSKARAQIGCAASTMRSVPCAVAALSITSEPGAAMPSLCTARSGRQ